MQTITAQEARNKVKAYEDMQLKMHEQLIKTKLEVVFSEINSAAEEGKTIVHLYKEGIPTVVLHAIEEVLEDKNYHCVYDCINSKPVIGIFW